MSLQSAPTPHKDKSISFELNNHKEGKKFSQGIQAFQKHQFDIALKIFESVYHTNPNSNEVGFYLANTYRNLGQYHQAISLYHILINQNFESSNVKVNLFYCLKNSVPTKYNPNLEQDVLSYLTFQNVNFDYISSYVCQLIQLKYDLINGKKSINLTDIINDKLIKKSLSTFLLTNEYIEMFVLGIRQTILNEMMQSTNLNIKIFDLASSLAIQQSINEYIYPIQKDEQEILNTLNLLLDKLLNKTDITIDEIITPVILIAMYQPLSQLSSFEQLIKIPLDKWPENIKPLIKQTVFDPIAEIHEISQIKFLGSIENKISKAVKQQYEENPYPRWKNLSFTTKTHYAESISQSLNRQSLPKHINSTNLNILVAGCGTGKHAIELAKSYPNANITAIDLSMTSLAYAQKKAKEYATENIEFLCSDILQLDDLKKEFNIIESIGVLHHLEDPLLGWKKLTQLLVKDGIMKIGLYSQLARQTITNARAIIEQQKISSTINGIRLFRQAAISGQYGKEIQELACHSTDFYSISGCRDLFFHVQEKQYTCETLQENLEQLNLEFLGFYHLNQKAVAAYKNQFKNKPMHSLKNWKIIEKEYPKSFSGMYQFWCQLK